MQAAARKLPRRTWRSKTIYPFRHCRFGTIYRPPILRSSTILRWRTWFFDGINRKVRCGRQRVRDAFNAVIFPPAFCTRIDRGSLYAPMAVPSTDGLPSFQTFRFRSLHRAAFFDLAVVHVLFRRGRQLFGPIGQPTRSRLADKPTRYVGRSDDSGHGDETGRRAVVVGSIGQLEPAPQRLVRGPPQKFAGEIDRSIPPPFGPVQRLGGTPFLSTSIPWAKGAP